MRALKCCHLASPMKPSVSQRSACFFFEPPPIMTAAETSQPGFLTRLVRKFDPAKRDALNRALGKLGEERILVSEMARLTASGRTDLAGKVRWTSQEHGDGAGFNVLSFSESGQERLLEVKTTLGHQRTPFYDFRNTPKAFELIPPLTNSVVLRPISYRASF